MAHNVSQRGVHRSDGSLERVIHAALETSGHLPKLRAAVRAAVLDVCFEAGTVGDHFVPRTLQDRLPERASVEEERNAHCALVFVQDFLASLGLTHTLDILRLELGLKNSSNVDGTNLPTVSHDSCRLEALEQVRTLYTECSATFGPFDSKEEVREDSRAATSCPILVHMLGELRSGKGKRDEHHEVNEYSSYSIGHKAPSKFENDENIMMLNPKKDIDLQFDRVHQEHLTHTQQVLSLPTENKIGNGINQDNDSAFSISDHSSIDSYFNAQSDRWEADTELRSEILHLDHLILK